MKLQHLAESTFDKSKFDVFGEEIEDAVEAFVGTISAKGFKLVATDFYRSGAFVKCSNGVFDIKLALDQQTDGKTTSYVTVLINQKYHCDKYPHFKDEISSSFNQNQSQDKLVQFLEFYPEQLLDELDQLAEWYMDVTGEYGKVKIYADWRGSISERKVVAIAGEFKIGANQGEVY